ncbi:hypothetical protein Tco_0302765 [Tanacetum coccineum]
MDGTPMEINMIVETKYPLIKELLEKMLNLQLEAKEESTMAFELIKFIKSMLEEFSIAASSSVPWIYLGQFWHTLKEDGSKYKLSFVYDRKELTMTLDDFRTIFYLPQATDNNHDHFVPALKFSKMVLFYINNLGFKLIMQMLYCFDNNIHVDYADLLWEGFHYSFEHLTTLIPYPRFTKLIVSYYMTAFPEISRRARDKYHNLEDDELVKSIFNSWKNNHSRSKSTQGTHRSTSAPRTTNPDVAGGESSASRKSTAIILRIPPRRSTRLTPPTPIPTIDEAEDIILQDTIQLSLAEHKSHEELKAKQNEEKVKEHLMAEEIEKLVEGIENVEEHEVDSSILRKNDKQNDPGTRLEPKSNKESPEVENSIAIQHVNINEEEEETEEDDYELKIREKGKDVEETRSTSSPTTIISPRIHSTLISPYTKKL